MLSRMIRLAAATLAAAVMPLATQAALVVYTTQASFLAAVSNAATDTFNDLSLGPTFSPLNRTAGTFGYTATATNNFFSVGSLSDVWLSTNNATDSIVFGSFTGGVSAIGGYFFNTDIGGAPQTGRNVTVAATDGDGTSSELLSNTTPTTFLGFVSTGLITSLTVTSDNSGSGGAVPFTWPTVNDLILAQRTQTQPPRPTPEPGTLALLGLAAVGLGAARRWRRQ